MLCAYKRKGLRFCCKAKIHQGRKKKKKESGNLLYQKSWRTQQEKELPACKCTSYLAQLSSTVFIQVGLAHAACSDSTHRTFLVKRTVQERICKLWEKHKFLCKVSLESFNSFPVTCPVHCRFLQTYQQEDNSLAASRLSSLSSSPHYYSTRFTSGEGRIIPLCKLSTAAESAKLSHRNLQTFFLCFNYHIVNALQSTMHPHNFRLILWLLLFYNTSFRNKSRDACIMTKIFHAPI